MRGGCVETSGPQRMLVHGGHSGVAGVNGAGVASWQSHFKVIGGHAGVRGEWGVDRSRDASVVTHRQAWSMGATLGWNEQETLGGGRHNGFRGANGKAGMVSGEYTELEAKMGDTEAELLVESPLGRDSASLGLKWSGGHTWAGRGGHSRQA